MLKLTCGTNFFQPMLKLKISPWGEISRMTVLLENLLSYIY